jgi:lambda repressor-like predicted transcriptional regulator
MVFFRKETTETQSGSQSPHSIWSKFLPRIRKVEGDTENRETNHPESRLAILINEGLKRKGMTIQKLSEASGIAVKHLENLSGGNIEKYPSAPYLRSYLIIIGRLLDFDGRTVWENIRVDELAICAGKNDRLPRERRIFSSGKNLIWLIGLATLLGLYLLFRLPEIIGQPGLEIGFPTEAITTVSVTPVTVMGTIKNGDEFFVNGERVPLTPDGIWQKKVDLQEGMNTIELRAKKFLGQETRVLRQIIYTPAIVSSSRQTASSTNGATNGSSTNKNSSSSENKVTSSRPRL